MKLLGILSNEDRREYGICYVNKRGDGQSSVNGNLATLFIVKPGDMPAYEGAACILRVSLLKDLEIAKWFYFCIFGNRNMEISACWCFNGE